MASIGELGVQIRRNLQPTIKIHRLYVRQRLVRICLGEERHGGSVSREAMAIRESRVLLLQPASVGQHQRTQVCRPTRAVNRPMESAGHQSREETRMIDVRVGEHDGVQRRGMNWKGSPVSPPQLLESLELSAVNQESVGHPPRADTSSP